MRELYCNQCKHFWEENNSSVIHCPECGSSDVYKCEEEYDPDKGY